MEANEQDIVIEEVVVEVPLELEEVDDTDDTVPTERTQAKSGTWGSIGKLALFAGVSLAAAAIGTRVMSRKTKGWYRLLRKSSATPPDRVFSLVWPVLYTLGAVSAWRVAKAPPSRDRTEALAWWGTQIVANGAWTPIFFGARKPKLAMADLVANWASVARYAIVAKRVDRPAAAMMLPYLGWLTFAGTLNGAVIAKNRGITKALLAD